MVSLLALWLPILVSGILVFIASSIIHTVLPYHKGDFRKLPDEDAFLDAAGKLDIPPGDYGFPRFCSMKELSSDEAKAKYAKGPVGYMTILSDNPHAMGPALTQWFLFCLVIGVFVAYLTSRTLAPDPHYLAVFRVAGTIAFASYGLGQVQESIWKDRSWLTTFKHLFDALVYGLLTGGVFGWLWPAA